MPTFKTILASKISQPCTVLDSKLTSRDFIHLDLSLHNKELQNIDVSSSKNLHQYIWDYKKCNGAKVAYGGYLEKRAIYQRSPYFNDDSNTERNNHLGLDLWLDEESEIFSPLDATIHSFRNNTNFGDYGPTIILEHLIDQLKFFTLYGHLSESSLDGLIVGQQIRKGEKFASLGDARVNGDYPPHLHFQIVQDITDYIGDYPGVCSKDDLNYYSENCPDPNILLKLD